MPSFTKENSGTKRSRCSKSHNFWTRIWTEEEWLHAYTLFITCIHNAVSPLTFLLEVKKNTIYTCMSVSMCVYVSMCMWYNNNNLTHTYWLYKIKHWTLLRNLRAYPSTFLSLGKMLFSFSHPGVRGGLSTNLQECLWINSNMAKPFTWKNGGSYVWGPLLKKQRLWKHCLVSTSYLFSGREHQNCSNSFQKECFFDMFYFGNWSAKITSIFWVILKII